MCKVKPLLILFVLLSWALGARAQDVLPASPYACLFSQAENFTLAAQVLDAQLGVEQIQVSPQDLYTLHMKMDSAMKSKYGGRFITQGLKYNRLKAAFERETTFLQQQNRLRFPYYKVYLVNDKTVNAFTAFGVIIVCTGILDLCESDEEVYAIIAHEIGHNEREHILTNMKRQSIVRQVLKDNYLQLKAYDAFILLATPLLSYASQIHELEADYFSIDLLHAMDMDERGIPRFWIRMGKLFNESSSIWTDWLRTHPAGDKRALCQEEYIRNTYLH